jgi:polysaccharide export outer membrane protein
MGVAFVHRVRLPLGGLLVLLTLILGLSPGWAQQAAARPKPAPVKPAPQPAPEAPRPSVPTPPEAPKETARPFEDTGPPVVEPVDRSKAYFLGSGDVLRVSIFQQPDMNSEGRVSEVGTYTVPLLGPVKVGGLTVRQAEAQIAYLLKKGGFVRDPQVNVNILAFKSRQVSVLGYVARPGRYYLEEGIYHVSDVLALAGGTVPLASDVVTLVREGRDGAPAARFEIDVPALYKAGSTASDLEVQPGDSLFVDRVPYFYIYGEVQRPGNYRLEKDMTVMQALSVGGGVTLRGSVKNMRINRKDKAGAIVTITPSLTDLVQADDVIFVRESLF